MYLKMYYFNHSCTAHLITYERRGKKPSPSNLNGPDMHSGPEGAKLDMVTREDGGPTEVESLT